MEFYRLMLYLKRLGYEAFVLLPRKTSFREVLKGIIDQMTPASSFIHRNINILFVDFDHLFIELVRNGIDTVVVGSDQVWRPEFMNVKISFCGGFDFSRIKVLSYAASFGFDKWIYNSAETDFARKNISKFSGISVREDSAVKLCDKYLLAKAQHVLDPTMLLNKIQYLQMCNIKGEKYIFCYLLGYKDNANIKFISNIQKRLEIRVKHIYLTNNKLLKRFRFQDTIQNWLSLICNSQLVITDSFHGTVFSIIFNKPFYVLLNNNGGNSRIFSLLKIFGLENRVIQSQNEIIDENIDWDNVNSELEKWKEKSLYFLKSILDD